MHFRRIFGKIIILSRQDLDRTACSISVFVVVLRLIMEEFDLFHVVIFFFLN